MTAISRQKLAGKFRLALIVLLSVIMFFASVEFLIIQLSIPEYLVPKPSLVFVELGSRPGFFLMHTGITAFESLTGFLIGGGLAYGIAVLLVLFPRVEKVGVAVGVAIKAIPIIVLAPLFVIWFGNGLIGKCLMAALVCFFPMLINGVSGLNSLDHDVTKYVKTLRISRWTAIRAVHVPASIPFVIAAAKITATVAIVGAIVAELSGADLGIGHVLLVSVYHLETVVMFAAITCITIFGLVFYGLVLLAESRLKRIYLA